MRLAEQTLNAVVNTVATRLSGGVLKIYDGDATGVPETSLATFRDPLVTIPFPDPAFPSARGGKTQAHPLAPVPIAVTGIASWARLVTSSGEVIAQLVVRAVDASDADEADVLVDRADFHRGGFCEIAMVSLRLPGSS